MEFQLTINTDNATFEEEEDRHQELASILRVTARRIAMLPATWKAFSFAVQDSNGNAVGRAELAQ